MMRMRPSSVWQGLGRMANEVVDRKGRVLSLDPQARQAGSTLGPRERAATGLVLVAALASIAGALAALWLAADLRARPLIHARLSGDATIAIGSSRTAGGVESSDAAAWRAMEILRSLPSVASARVLDPAPADQRLAASIGAAGSRTDPPRLVAVTFVRGARPPAKALQDRLAREGVAGAVDDHGSLTGPVERRSLLRLGTLAAVIGVMIAIFAGLGALGAARQVAALDSRLVLLTRLGMADRPLIGEVVTPLAVETATGALAGAAVAWLAEALGVIPMSGTAQFTVVDVAAVVVWLALAALAWSGAAILVAAGGLKRLDR